MASIPSSLLPLKLSYPNHNPNSLSLLSPFFPKLQPQIPSLYKSNPNLQRVTHICTSSNSTNNNEMEQESNDILQLLTVPTHWLDPSFALQESEWLRVTLHKWLDDEYCPEPTNDDISRVAAESYYQSLMNKITDLGEILLRMIRQLQTISYKESFHGAFSSANAAVNLIAQRIEESLSV